MLRTRIVTAIVLLAGLLAALFWLPETGWIMLVGALLAAAAWEWAALARIRPPGRTAYAAAISAAGIWAGWNTVTEIHSGFTWLYIIAIVFWAILAPLWLWERPTFGNPVMLLASGAAVLVPSATAMVELRNASPNLLLAIMAIVWISDIAAYFCGRRFGRDKLAPSISPAKTWEGVYGAAAAVTIYAVSWLAFGGRRPEALWHAPLSDLWFVLMLLGFAGAGIVGDLLESQMKRQAGVKDSGRLLPGHGGVLDRIDALLPVLPLAALAYLR